MKKIGELLDFLTMIPTAILAFAVIGIGLIYLAILRIYDPYVKGKHHDL